MVTDIEGWGGPERIGLRREASHRTLLARAGVALILLGAALLGLGWLTAGLGMLEPLRSIGVRWSGLLCAAGGAIALLFSRASFWNRP